VVCSGFSVGGLSSLDFGDDVLVQANDSGSRFHPDVQRSIVDSRSSTGVKLVLVSALRVNTENQSSIKFSHDADVGVSADASGVRCRDALRPVARSLATGGRQFVAANRSAVPLGCNGSLSCCDRVSSATTAGWVRSNA